MPWVGAVTIVPLSRLEQKVQPGSEIVFLRKLMSLPSLVSSSTKSSLSENPQLKLLGVVMILFVGGNFLLFTCPSRECTQKMANGWDVHRGGEFGFGLQNSIVCNTNPCTARPSPLTCASMRHFRCISNLHTKLAVLRSHGGAVVSNLWCNYLSLFL